MRSEAPNAAPAPLEDRNSALRTPHSALESTSRSDQPALPVLIYNGAGVVAEQPVIQQAPAATVTLPTSSRRRLVESLVLFVSAILFLRTITVEPFGVPTGSMA